MLPSARKPKDVIDDPALIDQIMRRAKVLRLGLSDRGQPYVVPMSFGWEPGKVWLHSGPKGWKLDIMRDNPRVCFEVEDLLEFLPGDQPCDWTCRYRTVLGFGRARLVEDEAEHLHGLKVIGAHYAGPGDYDLPPGPVKAATVICVEVAEMTARGHKLD